jgi:hypothetical protein
VRYGISGHQTLPTAAFALARERTEETLRRQKTVVGISSLAEGADQLFARTVLGAGGELEAVIPCAGYDTAFTSDVARRQFGELLGAPTRIISLPYPSLTEEAFLAAGLVVIERCEHLLAIWDGQDSREREHSREVDPAGHQARPCRNRAQWRRGSPQGGSLDCEAPRCRRGAR